MPEPGNQYGEFVLRREIGRGAMGTVWEAYQPSLDRTVAVKLLAGATASDPTWVRRFKAEAGAVAKLSHPGILPVYGIGETNGQHWFAMELVDGQDFSQHLDASGPLQPREAAKVIRHAALALHHAHEHGVIHRDVKPANVMLRKDGRVTMTDFGLAKHVGSGALTTTGLLIGTPYYMSPELVTARNTQAVGPAADVYGLGATLYELLTGKPPFDADNPMALLKQIGEKDPKPPTQIDPTIPRDLETIALTCLRKRPERRYPSAEALAEDLERFLEHQPIASRRPGPLERVGRFAQRNRLATGVAAAALLVLVGAVLLFTNALRTQEEDYERRIQQLLSQADTLADAGDAAAAEDLYVEAEEVARATPEVEHRVREARAGRQLARLMRNGALEKDVLLDASTWRNAPEGRLRIVTTPTDVTIRARALRAHGVEESVELPAEGGAVEPGLYHIELAAPGYVDSVVSLVAVPGMDATIEVSLPPADETNQGMIAYLGDWHPVRQSKGTRPKQVEIHRRGKPFLMDARATTNAEYGAFLASQPERARDALVPTSWSDGTPPASALDKAVHRLTAEQGEAYAAWRGKRLPSRGEYRAAMVPGLVLSAARIQQQVATIAPEGGPASSTHHVKIVGSPSELPPEVLGELHRLGELPGGEAVMSLNALRTALREAKEAEGAAGPWTFEMRTNLERPPPDRPRTPRLAPGLRLARDLP